MGWGGEGKLENLPGCIELDKCVSFGNCGGKRGGGEDVKSCFNHSLNTSIINGYRKARNYDLRTSEF